MPTDSIDFTSLQDAIAPTTSPTGLSAGNPDIVDVNYSTFDPFAPGNISLSGSFPSPTRGAMPGADGSNLPTSATANPNPTGDWMSAITAMGQAATQSMKSFVPSGPSVGIPPARVPVGSNYYTAAASRVPKFSSGTVILFVVLGLGLFWIVTHHEG